MGIDNVDFIVPFICASEKTRLRQLHLQQALMNRSYDAVYFHFLLLVCHTIHFILHDFCPLATAAGGGEGGPGDRLAYTYFKFRPSILNHLAGQKNQLYVELDAQLFAEFCKFIKKS